MPEQLAQVNTFENYKDSKSLAGWVTEKNEEIQRFIKANDGRWDDDRLAILDSRTVELDAAQKRLTQLQRVEDIYEKTVARKKDLSEPATDLPFENNGGDPNIVTADGRAANTKSLGELFTENKTYKSFGSHEESNKAPFSINNSFNGKAEVRPSTGDGVKLASPIGHDLISNDLPVRLRSTK